MILSKEYPNEREECSRKLMRFLGSHEHEERLLLTRNVMLISFRIIPHDILYRRISLQFTFPHECKFGVQGVPLVLWRPMAVV